MRKSHSLPYMKFPMLSFMDHRLLIITSPVDLPDLAIIIKATQQNICSYLSIEYMFDSVNHLQIIFEDTCLMPKFRL